MKSTIITLFIAAAFVGQSQAGGAAKAGSYNPGCVHFYTVGSTDTCSGVAAAYSITTTQLFSWNPKLHTTCDNLDNGSLVCVGITGSAVTDPPAGSSASSAAGASSVPAATSAKSSSKAASASAASSAVASASASVPAASASASSVNAASAAGSSAGPTATSASAGNGTSSTAPTVSVAKSAGTREQVSVALLLGAVAAVGVLAL